MRKVLMVILMAALTVPANSFAQEAGAFVGSLGLGLTSAQGDFANSQVFAAGSGFGMEGEVKFYPIGGFGIGAMANYMRFGSTYESSRGRSSFSFDQLGGLARLNLIRLSDGAIYLEGGGGIFTPSAHFYQPDNSTDQVGDKSGTYGFGGIGLTSFTDRKVMYEIDFKYNMARADFTLVDGRTIKSNVFDFVYVGMKLSFASKGKEGPPKY